MNHSDPWGERLTVQICDNIRSIRKSRGISAQGLSDLCTEIGHPIERRVISKMENHERSGISIVEVLALSRALDVPLVELLSSGDVVQLAPSVELRMSDAADAISGRSKRLSKARSALLDALDKLDEATAS